MLQGVRSDSCLSDNFVRIVRIEPKPRCSDDALSEQAPRDGLEPPSKCEPSKNKSSEEVIPIFRSSSAEVIQSYSRSLSTSAFHQLMKEAPLSIPSTTSVSSMQSSILPAPSLTSLATPVPLAKSLLNRSFESSSLSASSTASLMVAGKSASMNSLVPSNGGYSKKDRVTAFDGIPFDKIWAILESDNDEDFEDLIVRYGEAVIKARNKWHQTPLHLAAERGLEEIVLVLLDYEATDVNVRDKNGWTPLHLACNAGKWNICEILLRDGDPFVNCVNCDCSTPLHYMAKSLLTDNTDNNVAVFKRILDILLMRGADINAANKNGETPLHKAATMPNIIRILVENGANVNQTNANGETPLSYAINKASEESVATMIELGATVIDKRYIELANATKKQPIIDLITSKFEDENQAPNRSSDVLNAHSYHSLDDGFLVLKRQEGEQIYNGALRNRVRLANRVRSHSHLIYDYEIMDIMLQAPSKTACTWKVANCSNVATETVNKYRAMFSIDDDEPFIDEFACAYAPSVSWAATVITGLLLVWQRSVSFMDSATPGGDQELRFSISFADMLSITTVEGSLIEITTTNRKFIFKHFAASEDDVVNLLEFFRSRCNISAPLLQTGFPVVQMVGAIKRPQDYASFIEKHDYQRQGLLTSVSCTMQVYDECEGMLENPEQGKLYAATRVIRFTAQLGGILREREFAYNQILDITAQRKLQPAKIEIACVGLRYSLFNFRSVYEFDQTLAYISRIRSVVKSSPTILVVGASSLISLLIVKELMVKSNVRVLFSKLGLEAEMASIHTNADRVRALGAEVFFLDCGDLSCVQRALNGIDRILLINESLSFLDVCLTYVILEQIKKGSSNSTSSKCKLEFVARLSYYSESRRVEKDAPSTDETYEKLIQRIKSYITIRNDFQSLSELCCNAEKDPEINLSFDEQSELLIQRSTVPHNFVNTSWLMQQFAVLPIKSRGLFRAILIDGAVSWIDARDVAFAVATLLQRKMEELELGVRYILTGKEALNCHEAASILGELTETQIPCLKCTSRDVTRAIRICALVIPELREVLKRHKEARAGRTSKITNDLQKIIRQEPISLRQFISDFLIFFKNDQLNYFSREEIAAMKLIYQMIDTTNTNAITKQQLSNLLGTVSIESGLSDMIFATFEKKKEDSLSFEEYVNGLSIMCKGPVQRKLQVGFRMLDSDGDGIVCYKEFVTWVEKVKTMLGFGSEELDGVETFVSKTIFKLTEEDDLDRDDVKILEKEWIERCLSHLNELINLKVLTTPILPRNDSSREKAVVFGHPSWELVIYILLGISRCLNTEQPIVDPVNILSTPSLFEEKIEIQLNETDKCVFEEFAPKVFQMIRRQLLNIDDSAFVSSVGLGKMIANLVFGNLVLPQETISSGRSGSKFFRTHDKKYFLKTINPEEHALFKRLLPSYFEHLSNNQNTILTCFLGLYRLVYKGKEEWLILMTNIFGGEIDVDEQYDLKGSTVGRHVNECLASTEDLAMKDLNFKQRKINLGSVRRTLFLEQVEKDTKFLESHGICDYSFLIGIAYLPTNGITADNPSKSMKSYLQKLVVPSKSTNLNNSLFKQFNGGVLSEDKTMIYFFAIIDTLTPYSYKKMGEYWFKRVRHDKNQISAIPPNDYRIRFQKYLASITQ